MKDILTQIFSALETDDFQSLDSLLEKVCSSWTYSQEERDPYDDFLQEATLYSEFKEEEYKTEAIDIYSNIFKSAL